MLLGCIADDLTGATDLALILTRAGMRTVQIMQIPEVNADFAAFDAVVIALKSRTIPAADAVALSLRSADALLAYGAKQIFFKYCSTFDSTDAGNIGPVSDALMDRLGAGLAIACPAFPANKRTIYFGNLFVGDVPLAESSMRNHPLTPMRDSNLVRVLQRQTRRQVGLVPYSVVDQGADAIRAAFAAARARNDSYVIVDALSDRHLVDIGAAADDMPLITGGSGVAIGLPANYVRKRLMRAAAPPTTMPAPAGRAAILAGSCSEATRAQVKTAVAAGLPAFRIDPLAIAGGTLSAASLVQWAVGQPAARPILIYSSADPDAVTGVQAALGRDKAGALVEEFLAEVARGLVAAGFTRLLIAGGETSGAVVNALDIVALEIGPEIDPGVPWTRTTGEPALVLALKSGNFGATDFFLKAWNLLS
jgi:3-dehydrotetronate 4-kinase